MTILGVSSNFMVCRTRGQGRVRPSWYPKLCKATPTPPGPRLENAGTKLSPPDADCLQALRSNAHHAQSRFVPSASWVGLQALRAAAFPCCSLRISAHLAQLVAEQDVQACMEGMCPENKDVKPRTKLRVGGSLACKVSRLDTRLQANAFVASAMGGRSSKDALKESAAGCCRLDQVCACVCV